jgi:hypothetical protein
MQIPGRKQKNADIPGFVYNVEYPTMAHLLSILVFLSYVAASHVGILVAHLQLPLEERTIFENGTTQYYYLSAGANPNDGEARICVLKILEERLIIVEELKKFRTPDDDDDKYAYEQYIALTFRAFFRNMFYSPEFAPLRHTINTVYAHMDDNVWRNVAAIQSRITSVEIDTMVAELTKLKSCVAVALDASLTATPFVVDNAALSTDENFWQENIQGQSGVHIRNVRHAVRRAGQPGANFILRWW